VDREATRKERLVKNELAARGYNRRRLHLELDHDAGGDEEVPFLCECGDSTCASVMEITPEEYVEAHAQPTRFTVLPSHVAGEVEWIVATHPGYWIVEKRPSALATVR
jgi:hypothetical protein